MCSVTTRSPEADRQREFALVMDGFTGPTISATNIGLINWIRKHFIDLPRPYVTKFSMPIVETPQAKEVDKISHKVDDHVQHFGPASPNGKRVQIGHDNEFISVSNCIPILHNTLQTGLARSYHQSNNQLHYWLYNWSYNWIWRCLTLLWLILLLRSQPSRNPDWATHTGGIIRTCIYATNHVCCELLEPNISVTFLIRSLLSNTSVAKGDVYNTSVARSRGLYIILMLQGGCI